MTTRKIFSLSSLAAASLFGWTLFIVLTFDEVRSAIVSIAPFLGEGGSLAVFCIMAALFSLSGLLICLGVSGDILPKVVLRILLGAVFLMAAIPKIMDPGGFALDISHYDTFPKFAINIIAIALPWVEGLIALSLISGFLDRGGVLLTNLLMIAFLGLLGLAWVRGLDIDCGCFGHSGAREAVSKAFMRDLFFILWSVVLFLYLRKDDSSKPLEARAAR